MSQLATGFVYVLHAQILPGARGWSRSSNGPYKIGISADPVRRRSELSIIGGVTLTLVHTIQASQPRVLERAIHEYFAAKDIGHEWFALNTADIAWLLQIEAI
jgi:hypothetical protein